MCIDSWLLYVSSYPEIGVRVRTANLAHSNCRVQKLQGLLKNLANLSRDLGIPPTRKKGSDGTAYLPKSLCRFDLHGEDGRVLRFDLRAINY